MERRYRSRLLLLREWKRVVEHVARAVEKLYPEAEVYLIGGAAEGRLTVHSDIDVAVVFYRSLSWRDRVEVLERIWEALENEVPMYYPLEIHVLESRELTKLRGRKVKLT